MKLRLIQIQTTSICNARCIFCPYGNSWMIDHVGVMDWGLYENILRQIKDIDPDFSGRFCPYLMNEPFTDKDLDKRIELAYKYLPNMELEISTNAGVMFPNRMKKVVDTILKYNKNPNTKIIISHHGVDKESLEYIMKIPYESTIRNIIEFLRYNNGRIPVTLKGLGVSMDENIGMFTEEEYNRYWNTIFHKYNIPPNNITIMYSSFHNRAGNVKMNEWKYSPKIREIDKDHPFDCPRLHGMIHILFDGTVVSCCMDYLVEYPLGNVKEKSIVEIFKDKPWKDFYAMARGRKPSPDNFICKRCMSPGG